MKRENYIITVKSIYIRDAEMFCPESMTEQEILNLEDIDIFQSCEFERYGVRNGKYSRMGARFAAGLLEKCRSFCLLMSDGLCRRRIKKGTSENCRIFQDTSLFFRSNSCKKRFGR